MLMTSTTETYFLFFHLLFLNLFLTAKFLKQGYIFAPLLTFIDIIKKHFLPQTFRNVKYNIGLKTFLQQGISEPIFNGDLVYNSNELLEIIILVINSKR